jgi:FPC/CPF motif-containing protein YcgG
LDNCGDKGGHHKLAELLTEKGKNTQYFAFKNLVDVCEELRLLENSQHRFWRILEKLQSGFWKTRCVDFLKVATGNNIIC